MLPGEVRGNYCHNLSFSGGTTTWKLKSEESCGSSDSTSPALVFHTGTLTDMGGVHLHTNPLLPPSATTCRTKTSVLPASERHHHPLPPVLGDLLLKSKPFSLPLLVPPGNCSPSPQRMKATEGGREPEASLESNVGASAGANSSIPSRECVLCGRGFKAPRVLILETLWGHRAAIPRCTGMQGSSLEGE